MEIKDYHGFEVKVPSKVDERKFEPSFNGRVIRRKNSSGPSRKNGDEAEEIARKERLQRDAVLADERSESSSPEARSVSEQMEDNLFEVDEVGDNKDIREFSKTSSDDTETLNDLHEETADETTNRQFREEMDEQQIEREKLFNEARGPIARTPGKTKHFRW